MEDVYNSWLRRRKIWLSRSLRHNRWMSVHAICYQEGKKDEKCDGLPVYRIKAIICRVEYCTGPLKVLRGFPRVLRKLRQNLLNKVHSFYGLVSRSECKVYPAYFSLLKIFVLQSARTKRTRACLVEQKSVFLVHSEEDCGNLLFRCTWTSYRNITLFFCSLSLFQSCVFRTSFIWFCNRFWTTPPPSKKVEGGSYSGYFLDYPTVREITERRT